MASTIDPLSHQNTTVKSRGETQLFISNTLFIWKRDAIFLEVEVYILLLPHVLEELLMVTEWTVQTAYQHDIFFCQNDNTAYN